LRGKDVAGQAQTGTGKTAAFLLATFQYLINAEDPLYDEEDTDYDEDEIDTAVEKVIVKPIKNTIIKYPRAIILAPTRELAIQIHKDALQLSKRLNLSFALIYGGTDYQKQLTKVKTNVDIIIGTPGRIIDFYRQNAFTLDNVKVMVWTKPTACLTLGLSKIYAFYFVVCRHQISA
jgi:ATP-dependent RNA helicase RhlB